MPIEIQLNALHQIPALRDIKLFRPGYAIEYDFFQPTQLNPTLETKRIANLYFAGQINGTTGYEEAACQGLIAGINAHLKINNSPEFVLGRDDAYIGVLIDDLVTKGVDEPYRMFTSRAEYRILLRQDDADMRLTEKGYNLGLATSERYKLLNEKKAQIEHIIDFAKTCKVKPTEINSLLDSVGSTTVSHTVKLIDLLLRPQLSIDLISASIPQFAALFDNITSRKEEIIEAAEIKIKYEGYIERERIIADKIHRLENIKIKDRIDYNSLQSLSTEAKQKLIKINPETIAQAARIPGVSPNDINVLLVLLGR